VICFLLIKYYWNKVKREGLCVESGFGERIVTFGKAIPSYWTLKIAGRNKYSIIACLPIGWTLVYRRKNSSNHDLEEEHCTVI
jgi:hypothetical protein